MCVLDDELNWLDINWWTKMNFVWFKYVLYKDVLLENVWFKYVLLFKDVWFQDVLYKDVMFDDDVI